MVKHPHRFVLLALLILAGVIVSPVLAAEYSSTMFPAYDTKHYYGEQVYSFSHDAMQEDMRIALIYFTVPTDAQVNFTLYYGNASTVDGYMENHHINPLQTETTVYLGGNSSTYTYLDTNYFYDIDVAGYAKLTNDTSITGFMVSSDSYGLFDNDLAAFYSVDDIQRNLIYKVVAESDAPFSIEIVDGSPSDVSEGVAHTPGEMIAAWVDIALSLGGTLLGVVLGLFAWMKFLFVDNLFMIIALYLGITMAYAAGTSKDIFSFYKKFFGYQKKLFEFILGLWKLLIELVATFRGIFRI